MQKVQDQMLAEVQGWCRPGPGVQRRCRWCTEGAGGGAGYLHRLHLNKHNIRCNEVQGVQANLRFFLFLAAYGGQNSNHSYTPTSTIQICDNNIFLNAGICCAIVPLTCTRLKIYIDFDVSKSTSHPRTMNCMYNCWDWIVAMRIN